MILPYKATTVAVLFLLYFAYVSLLVTLKRYDTIQIWLLKDYIIHVKKKVFIINIIKLYC